MITYDGGTTGVASGDLNDYYSRFKIFVNASDGIEENVTKSQGNYGWNGDIGTLAFFFGKHKSAGNHPKDGVLNQLAIWSSDQSANVSTIYNAGATQDLSLLVDTPDNYYEIEDSITLVNDLIGNAHLVGYNFTSSDLVNDAP